MKFHLVINYDNFRIEKIFQSRLVAIEYASYQDYKWAVIEKTIDWTKPESRALGSDKKRKYCLNLYISRFFK